jgi:hypothetical protein
LALLPVAGNAQTPVPTTNSTVLNITLGEQRVKFAPTRSFEEMRLEVVNSVGEIVFTHTTAEAEFDWNLRAGNGEPLAPGLYQYALTLKFSEDQARQHTGHFIVEKSQDRLWLTTNGGAEISGTALNVARTGGRSVAGAARAGDKTTRDVSGRTVVDESGAKQAEGKTVKQLVRQEKAALLGTVNMVAKFDAGGVNVIDSAMIETGGNVGLGTTAPNAKLSVSANVGAPPSASGIIAYFANANESNTFLTADSYGNGPWHSDFLFRRARGTMAAPAAILADDIVGQIQMRGYGTTGFAPTSRAGIRLTAAENWSDTAQGAYLAFLTTPKLSNAINVERMRITDAGNVGIGITAPTSKLAVASTAATPAVTATGTAGEGLHGESNPTFGVFGSSVAGNGVAGTGSTGVYGQGSVNGVLGETTVMGGYGVHGKNTAGGRAGYFEGNVDIVGNLTKTSGTFRIDHPLDPANKYLSHSFVESPDMMNIYNGVTQLDRRGRAVVTLPDYFEALNQDFRYQLTCVGGFAPVYIAREIEGNQFVIAGGKSGMKVSWQITGVRRDAYANDHRIKVEEEKPAHERGTYLYPGAARTASPVAAQPLSRTHVPMPRAAAQGRR